MGDKGQPALETVALAAGKTGWLRMSAQALRCAKTDSAEAPPRCALLWSSENAAGAKRDRKLQVLGARRVPRRHLPGQALALSAGRLPRPLGFFSEFPSPSFGMLTTAQVLGTSPTFPVQPLSSLSRDSRQAGGRIHSKGKAVPALPGGRGRSCLHCI